MGKWICSSPSVEWTFPNYPDSACSPLRSVLNTGASLGSALGAGLTASLGVTSDNFDHLFVLVALCNAATLLPAPFLRLLPAELEKDPLPQEKEEEMEGDREAGAVSGLRK